ncbi:MAG TPA: peptide deformylase [Rhodospirillaceae bacterium]|nr:peptide deformylase [Rhodospirillaceae bacterium]
MAILEIRTVPDPVLRQKAAPIAAIDKEIVTIIQDMLETMYTDGIGLAANQVGILKRVIVLDISDSRDGSEALIMVNPTILESSKDTFTYREGCLSVRPVSSDNSSDLFANVTRPRKIRVRYLDQTGKTCEIEAEELLSQCIQHEMDHLDGVLFTDHVSALKRNMIMRKIEKLRRNMSSDKPL